MCIYGKSIAEYVWSTVQLSAYVNMKKEAFEWSCCMSSAGTQISRIKRHRRRRRRVSVQWYGLRAATTVGDEPVRLRNALGQLSIIVVLCYATRRLRASRLSTALVAGCCCGCRGSPRILHQSSRASLPPPAACSFNVRRRSAAQCVDAAERL